MGASQEENENENKKKYHDQIKQKKIVNNNIDNKNIKESNQEKVVFKIDDNVDEDESISDFEVIENYSDYDDDSDINENEKKNIKKVKSTFIHIDLISNNKKDNKFYLDIIWIDEKVHNSENQSYFKKMKDNYPYIKIELFDNLEEGFNNILNLEFVSIFVIVSGRLYSKYYYKLKTNLNKIKCIPVNIIFTSNKFKKILENKEPDTEQIISYDIQKSINN